MKLFLGHLIGFTMAAGITFAAMAVLLLFFPLLGAFISWSTDPLSFGWGATFVVVRFMILIAAGVGLGFTFSKEGSEAARLFAND